jgi:hypothetical protein
MKVEVNCAAINGNAHLRSNKFDFSLKTSAQLALDK